MCETANTETAKILQCHCCLVCKTGVSCRVMKSGVIKEAIRLWQESVITPSAQSLGKLSWKETICNRFFGSVPSSQCQGTVMDGRRFRSFDRSLISSRSVFAEIVLSLFLKIEMAEVFRHAIYSLQSSASRLPQLSPSLTVCDCRLPISNISP